MQHCNQLLHSDYKKRKITTSSHTQKYFKKYIDIFCCVNRKMLARRIRTAGYSRLPILVTSSTTIRRYKAPIVSTSILNTLPSHLSTESLWPILKRTVELNPRKLICLDDDPTGCQTAYDVNVLLDYTVEVKSIISCCCVLNCIINNLFWNSIFSIGDSQAIAVGRTTFFYFDEYEIVE